MDRVERIEARAYTVPTDRPESDGTLEWDSTTILVVTASGGGRTGLGYSYTHAAASRLVDDLLADLVRGRDVLDVGGAWAAMWRAVRNIGQTGLAATAVSAVDVALWDLKARVLDMPLVVALDAIHESVPVYGSGGFCSYTDAELAEQLAGWVDAGVPDVKMKVGRDPERDEERVRFARTAIGPDTGFFVDANGAYSRAEARRWSRTYDAHGVIWFEEPVSSDDLTGLADVRARAPSGVEVAAGEYGWALPQFRAMLEAGAVDCLQADVTRCGGLTGFRRVAALCDSHGVDLSAHCAPQISAHALPAAWHPRHIEYFHDHVRIEHLLLDGCLEPADGRLAPDRTAPGHGLSLREAAGRRWRVA